MNTYLRAAGGFVLLGALVLLPGQSEAYCNESALGITTYGASGQTTVALQQCLIEAGYGIPAGATGYYGQQTRKAVQQFYAAQLGMPDWDGYSVGPIGRSTLASLASSPGPVAPPVVSTGESGYKQLANAAELKEYLEAKQYSELDARSAGLQSESAIAVPTVADDMMGAPAPMAEANVAKSEPGRVSNTNVQIAGIDEPDIVKTDGQNIFYSREQRWYGWREPMIDVTFDEDTAISESIAPYPIPEPDTNPTVVVDAFPVDDLAVIGDGIEEQGEMLLVKDEDILIIFSWPKVVAYDVSNSKNPKKVWERELGDNTNVVTSRLLDGEVYMVTQSYINREKPCPVVPMRWGDDVLSIPCTSIMVPDRVEPVNNLYTVIKVDAIDGSVEAKTAVAGDSYGVTTMMSMDSLYLASRAVSSEEEVMLELVLDTMDDYLPAYVTAKMQTIAGYDISMSGKMNEIELVYYEYMETLTDDERLRVENELENTLMDKLTKRMRDMYQSRIARISLDTLAIEATGIVPGYLLNQFAMDEYEGNLRVAVTVDDGWGGGESFNDVYVLNDELKTIGNIQDLGLTERIYSVRFMGDTGYLVTFRQIDPFYVLDLSVPTAPKMVGELKIPGYSAYLEYLGDDLVLGVGREDGGVKLSIFDVSNPAKPVEKSKYQLSDYWTEVESNHRAFLRDAKHEVFFIPGSQGGYVFSYEDGELSLEKAIAETNVKRALYIDDNLYIVSEDLIRVFDETDWEEVAKLELN